MGISKEKVANIRGRLARHRERRIGSAKKKVLLLLFGGLALGLSGSPRSYWKIVGGMKREWDYLAKQTAERAINALYASKLVSAVENTDGTFTLVLTEKGRRRTLTYNLSEMKIKKPERWDKLWRLVAFDVPIGKKEVRDSLRGHLLRLGFYEFQQSLFLHPFDCLQEITYITELYDARRYVRFMLVSHLDNEPDVKRFFGFE